MNASARGVAFLYGWMCLLVLDPGLSAALATGAARYLAYIFHCPSMEIKSVAVVAVIVLALRSTPKKANS